MSQDEFFKTCFTYSSICFSIIHVAFSKTNKATDFYENLEGSCRKTIFLSSKPTFRCQWVGMAWGMTLGPRE